MLNKLTIPDSNSLTLMDDALDQVAGATVFSPIDLIGVYPQMRARQKDMPETAARTCFGLLE